MTSIIVQANVMMAAEIEQLKRQNARLTNRVKKAAAESRSLKTVENKVVMASEIEQLKRQNARLINRIKKAAAENRSLKTVEKAAKQMVDRFSNEGSVLSSDLVKLRNAINRRERYLAKWS